MKKKPRTDGLVIGHKDKFSGVKYNEVNNEILIRTAGGQWIKPDSVSSETYYQRESGKEKSINQITGRAVIGESAILLHMVQSFDVGFAIDTNTKTINGAEIFVSAIFQSYFEKGSSENIVKMRFRPYGFIFFKNCPNASTTAEKAAWLKLVRILNSHPEYKNQKIALITDHDKGNHAKINNREVAFFLDEFLPENITMIYAGSDTPNDGALNTLIKGCDREASALLKSFRKESYCSVNGHQVSLENDIPECDDKFSSSIYLSDN